MSLHHSPRIVTDNLVLCLDAGNSRSYPGSGTTWTDLSGKTNNGTLTNGPTFNSSNYGSVVLDGVDDYISLKNKPDLTLTNFSYMCWYYPTSFNPNYNTIFGRENARHFLRFSPNGQYSVFLRGNLFGTNGVQFHTEVGNTSVVALNTWQNATLTINWTTSTFNLYHNAINIWSYTNTNLGTNWSDAVTQDAVLGSRYQGAADIAGETARFIGRISNFTYYNSVLTAAEINQNFNALRGRFGL